MENLRLNRLDDRRVWCANCDALELLRLFLAEKFRIPAGKVFEPSKDEKSETNDSGEALELANVILNLPELSVDFLKAY